MRLKPFKFTILIITSILLLAIMNSCSDQQDPLPPESPAAAPEKFYLGLTPEQDLFSQKKRYAPLARYISEKAGIDVEIKMLPRYGNIVENFTSSKLDAAFFGSFTGAMAIKKLEVEPLARPLWIDNTSTYYGMVFVRKDSSIKDANDMKGKTFVFVDRATTAGWLLPLNYFVELGIGDFQSWFSETYFAGTHEDAIYDVLDRKADIGAAKNTVYFRLASKDVRILNELQILTKSPQVPANALAVRKDLDNSLKIKLQNILLQMDHDKQGRDVLLNFGAKKFIQTTPNDYEPVFTYAEKIRLDLTKYNYSND
jgi:phosphonate transport system substrate-binding protein